MTNFIQHTSGILSQAECDAVIDFFETNEQRQEVGKIGSDCRVDPNHKIATEIIVDLKELVEDNRLNVTGGESAKLFDITDTQSHQFQSFPEFTLRSKPSDSQTTASSKMYKWNDPITGNRVIGNLDKFNLFNIENPDNPITEIYMKFKLQ